MQSGLQNDPDNAELCTLKLELDEAIALAEAAVTDLRAAAASSLPLQPSSPPTNEKWSKQNHPAFQTGHRRHGGPPALAEDRSLQQTQLPQAAYKVNDAVLARWVSGDKSFYPARITSITGSSSSPLYSVTFKSYGNTETLRAADIKPHPLETKKRKADGTPALPSASSTETGTASVISAAADINPALASQARREPSKVSDGPTRPPKVPRKVKATKELEAGKSKWQDFTTKGKLSKVAKKESMFRTPDGVNARGMVLFPLPSLVVSPRLLLGGPAY